MGWENNRYIYSKRILKVIAENYGSLYDGLPLSPHWEETNPITLAEYKADFDRALNSIGRGHWQGNLNGYKPQDYRHYGRLQQLIIADILGAGEQELLRMGFYDIPRLRGFAYYLMTRFLNGE